MLKFLIIIIFVCICLIAISHHIFMERNKKTLLTSSKKIPIETVISFSIFELTDRLKAYYGKNGTKVLVEYADKKYIELDTSESQMEMIKKLDEVQDFMISKRYNPDDEYMVKDYINKIMYDIWLDYAYKTNYKKLFWREMDILFRDGEVSEASFNEVYRRFYKYKILEDNNN